MKRMLLALEHEVYTVANSAVADVNKKARRTRDVENICMWVGERPRRRVGLK